MKVLVIGGTNFIGPHVVRYLMAAGHSVMVFHRGKTIAQFEGEVAVLHGDRQHLQEAQADIQAFAPDVVVDMIAYTAADAQTVVETIQGWCSRVVVISSQDVYRARDILWGVETREPDPTPLTETAPLRSHYYPYRDIRFPGIPKDYDKILVERAYLDASDIHATILRLPMVYGPGDPLHRFAAYLHRMERQRPVIALEETFAHWRSSYGYVENVAWAIALAVNRPQAGNRIFNVSETEPLTERARVKQLGQCVHWSGKVITVTRQQLPEDAPFPFNMKQDWVTDSTYIRQTLGYRERVPQAEAMQQTIAWQRSHYPDDISQSASAIALFDEAYEDRWINQP